jgi:hypothetical protein
MQHRRALTITAIYGIGIMTVAIAQAAGLPPQPDTFGIWFTTSIDWRSFGASAVAGLLGGVVRTLATLRSAEPTERPILELLGDAMTALASGFVVFMLLMGWTAAFNPVPHAMTFALSFLAGMLRGGVFSWIDEGSKKVLGAITDGFVTFIAAKAAQISQPKEPKP